MFTRQTIIATILIINSICTAQFHKTSNKTIKLSYSYFGGKAYVDGDPMTLSFLSKELEPYFSQNDSALKAYKSFKGAKIVSAVCIPIAAVGLIMAFAGTETEKADTPQASYNPNTGQTEFDNEKQSFNGVGVTGLVLLGGGTLVGLITNFSSKTLIKKAVKKYNENQESNAKIYMDLNSTGIKTKLSLNF